jgi:hypothetical protein
MKNIVRLFSLLITAGFFLTACEGPVGPPGKDANAACETCHNTPNWDAKQNEYHLSKHYLGTTSARNQKYCARCHTNEGFQEITGDGQFVVASEIPTATRINCETCHKHSAFDFSDDTVTFVLRTTTPVALNYDNNATTTDFGKIDNLCVTCHQIRGATAVNYTDSTGAVKPFNQLPFFPLDNTIDPNSTVKYQVGQSFAVHDGNQSNLFAGINGYEYPGKTYTRTWHHSTNNCTDCHMNEYNADTKTGGHTLIPNEQACEDCHGSDKITPVQTSITAKLGELSSLLVARKLYVQALSHGTLALVAEPSHDFYGVLFPTTQSTKKYATALVSANTVGPTSGILVYANTVTISTDNDYAHRIGREWKYGELGAAYNYEYINSEKSLGVHNPTYALQLLQNSIDWLNAN